MNDAWSIVPFPSELQGQRAFTMSSHFVKLNKPCSLNSPSLYIQTFQDDALGHFGCVNALTKQPSH